MSIMTGVWPPRRGRNVGRIDPRLATTNAAQDGNPVLSQLGVANVAFAETIIYTAALAMPTLGTLGVRVNLNFWTSISRSGFPKTGRTRIRIGNLAGRIVYDSTTFNYTVDSVGGFNMQQLVEQTDTPTAGDRLYVLTFEANTGIIWVGSAFLSAIENGRGL